jgi:glycosyltransferase involved in cell wall biosynthesis
LYKDKTIGVVIPAYNEEKLIGQTIESVPDYVDKVIVVNDCSRDNTAAIVETYVEKQPERVLLIQHTANQGVGGAIASGYKWCRDNGMDVAVVMAGDAQMDPTDLPDLLDPVVRDEVDYTKGNRLITGDAWHKIPRVRYLGNSALSLLTKIASGYWHVADSQCGYTAINAKALKIINWDDMYKRYGQPNDLLVRLNVYNFRVRDVMIKPVYGVGEKSGIKPLRMIPRLSKLLFNLYLWRMWQKYVIRDFHPLIFFYLLSFFLILLSIPLSIRIIWILILTGNAPPINTLAFMFTAIMGVQSLFFAMWFDMEYNKDLR